MTPFLFGEWTNKKEESLCVSVLFMSMQFINRISGLEAPAGKVTKKEKEHSEWYPQEAMDVVDRIVRHKRQKNGFMQYVEREREYTGIRQVEREIKKMSRYEVTLNAFLRRYGAEGVVRRIGEDVVAVQKNKGVREMLDRLPEHFVYVGGAARAALERSLGIDAYASPRDIDIAVMNKEGDKIDSSLLDAMSQRYMPEDYAHGHGVKNETVEYFETRDFTINQVFATNESVYCTMQCLLDTLRGVIRITEFERQESYQGKPYYIHPKLLAKALRLAVQRGMKIEDADVYDFQEIDTFHMALHLDRAAEQGVADAYIRELRERKQIPDAIYSVDEMLDYLEGETDFIFRCVSYSDERQEEAWLKTGCPWDAIEEEFLDSPMREGMGRRSKEKDRKTR